MRAGVPVLELGVDNFNPSGSDAEQIEERMRAFIEGLDVRAPALTAG